MTELGGKVAEETSIITIVTVEGWTGQTIKPFNLCARDREEGKSVSNYGKIIVYT